MLLSDDKNLDSVNNESGGFDSKSPLPVKEM